MSLEALLFASSTMMAVTAHAAQFSSNNPVSSNNIREFSLLNHCQWQGGRRRWTTEDLRCFFWKLIFMFVDFRPRPLPLWKSHHRPEGVAGAVTETGSNTHFPLANTVSCVVEAHIQGLNWGGTVRWASEKRRRPTLIIWLKSTSWWVNVSTKNSHVRKEYAESLHRVLMLLSCELLLSSAVCVGQGQRLYGAFRCIL